MNRFLRMLVTLIWGLWLGGLVMLFCSVQVLFNHFADRRELAGEGAAAIFRFFAFYHLALAAAALLVSFGWRLIGGRGSRTWVFVLFALATLAAVDVTALLVPQMEHLRAAGLSHSAKFRQLHGISMGIFMVETILVFVGGLVVALVSDGVKATKVSTDAV